ncbi:MAG: hypothetical protein V2A58_17220 [Planctomycetota bacterium]
MNARTRKLLDQPAAFKLVFDPRDHYINDHCLVRDDRGLWHLFYIYFPRDSRRSAGGRLEYGIGHATSPDLIHWKEVGICLREDPGAWDADAIYAPYVHRSPKGAYVMLYCGSGDSTQRIGAATSDDLAHWEKHDRNPVITPATTWSGWVDTGYHSCRDPHVLEIAPGRFLCYYTADLARSASPDASPACCIAAAESSDLLRWRDLGPVCVAPKNFSGPGQVMMESPGVLFRDHDGAKSYLLHFTHRFGVSYVTSPDPLSFPGPPRLLGPYHASEIFQDPSTSSWFITSCCQRLAVLYLPNETIPFGDVQEGLGLFLAGLTWVEGHPVVVDLARFAAAGCIRLH